MKSQRNATPANVSQILSRAAAGSDLSKLVRELVQLNGFEGQLERLAAACSQLQLELDAQRNEAHFHATADYSEGAF